MGISTHFRRQIWGFRGAVLKTVTICWKFLSLQNELKIKKFLYLGLFNFLYLFEKFFIKTAIKMKIWLYRGNFVAPKTNVFVSPKMFFDPLTTWHFGSFPVRAFQHISRSFESVSTQLHKIFDERRGMDRFKKLRLVGGACHQISKLLGAAPTTRNYGGLKSINNAK